MDFQQFQEVLLGCLDACHSAECSAVIGQIKQTDYPLYINLLLETISQNKCERAVYSSITQLYHEVKCKNIFNCKPLINNFCQKFGNVISLALVSDTIEDNFKMLMAYILSILHVYIFNSDSNVNILEYILTSYITTPSIRKYLLHCTYEIISNDNALGGLSPNDLLQLLMSDIDDEALFSPKVHLLFSLALKVPNSSELEDIFCKLFTSCTQDNFEDFVKTLSDFTEQGLGFLGPHLPQIVQKICEFAVNHSIPEIARNMAIICLGSIAKGAPEMCSSAEEYYVPVIQTLLHIASEIDDNSPWEFDPNNFNPYQCALDTLGIIFHAFQCPKMFASMCHIVNNVTMNRDSPWQVLYAVFATIAEVDIITLSNMLDPDNEIITVQMLGNIAHFIDINCHPRVRIAIYNLISKLVSVVLSPENGHHVILIAPLLKITAEETFPISKKYAYKALADFLKQITCKNISSYFGSLFPQLINELQGQLEDYVRKYIIRCLGHLMKGVRDPDANSVQLVFQLISNHLQSSNPEILTEAIHCFSLSMAHIPSHGNDPTQLCVQFFQNAVQLLENVTEESAESLNDSIHQLISIMGESVTNLIPSVLPKILENSQKAITVEKCEAFNTDLMLPSLYTKIPSNENAVKIYILKNDINEVYYYLNILDAFVSSDPNSMRYIEQVLNICHIWISNQYPIEKLQIMCWTILTATIEKFKEDQILEFIFQIYLDSIVKRGSHNYISKVINKMIICMDLVGECNWNNTQTFALILQTIPDLTNYIMEMKSNKVVKLAEYNKLDTFNKEVACYDLCQISIVDFLTLCFKARPDITIEFFNQFFGLIIEKYLADPNTLIFGIMLSTIYIINARNNDKAVEFLEFLSNNARNFDRQDELILNCFLSMGNLFSAFPFGQQRADLASRYLKFFIYYFNLEPLNEDSDSMNMISDNANIAFAKFIKANIDVLDSFEVVNAFFDAPSIWDCPTDIDVYFSLIAFILENGLVFLYDEWPDVVVGRLLTGFMAQQYSENLRKRFAVFLNSFIQNENIRNYIIEIINAMGKKRQAAFMILMSLEDLA